MLACFRFPQIVFVMVNNIRAIYFPYCLQRLPDKTWILLNRNYKPVGGTIEEWADYNSVPKLVRIKSLSEAAKKKISYSPDISGDQIHLYNDGCIPTDSIENMAAYLKRLEALMKLKTVGGSAV